MAKKKEKKERTLSEEEVLEFLSKLSDEEFEILRAKNKKHKAQIAQRTFRNKISELIKRVIDLFSGIIGSILLIPITIFVWILKIANREKGPIIYDQLRIGKKGKIFKMYKFRTMVVGADEILDEYLKKNKKAAKEYKINKKLKDDPRITKSGKILRRLSLDEFPQFINILKGDMSLVGPRPYLPREKKDMGKYYKIITEVKPGLTGPWQVAGRSNLTFSDRLLLDEEYCARCGNRRDFKILLRTFKKVFGKEGAE